MLSFSPSPGAAAAAAATGARATAARAAAAAAAAAAVAAAALSVLARGHRELLGGGGLQSTRALLSVQGTRGTRDSCSNTSASTELAAPRKTCTSVLMNG